MFREDNPIHFQIFLSPFFTTFHQQDELLPPEAQPLRDAIYTIECVKEEHIPPQYYALARRPIDCVQIDLKKTFVETLMKNDEWIENWYTLRWMNDLSQTYTQTCKPPKNFHFFIALC